MYNFISETNLLVVKDNLSWKSLYIYDNFTKNPIGSHEIFSVFGKGDNERSVS